MTTERGESEKRTGGIRLRSAKGGGSGAADESGGRSTGTLTGFGGGRFGSAGGGARAVVKGNYTRAGNARSIKASGRYYTTRENERGERTEREAFSADRDTLARAELNGRIDQADRDHGYHYRMVVSPGTDRHAEGVDLREYTREVMRELERQTRGEVSWVAVEHGGNTAHTARAHLHVIASTDEVLGKETFAHLRDHATQAWESAKERVRELERDHTAGRDVREAIAMLARHREALRTREHEPASGRSAQTLDDHARRPERDFSRDR